MIGVAPIFRVRGEAHGSGGIHGTLGSGRARAMAARAAAPGDALLQGAAQAAAAVGDTASAAAGAARAAGCREAAALLCAAARTARAAQALLGATPWPCQARRRRRGGAKTRIEQPDTKEQKKTVEPFRAKRNDQSQEVAVAWNKKVPDLLCSKFVG